MSKKILLLASAVISSMYVMAQKVDYSVVSVPEEAGIEFLQVSAVNDNVCMPIVKRNRRGVSWVTNQVIDISPDGKQLAYLSWRNNSSNIFIKMLEKQGVSVQRTNRSLIQDFSYSPDGKLFCFSEKRGKYTQLFVTDANSGYVCRQITSANEDYSPVYSPDMSQIIFARKELQNISVWSYDVANNFLSSYVQGMNPYCTDEPNTIICSRLNAQGRCEIWKVNYMDGVEECIISDPHNSYTSPRLSPDGEWMLFVGSSKIVTDKFVYFNTDIYVARVDGSEFMQLTYHAADDLSPVWSKDGKYIYFVSQRGNKEGDANIWRMTFNPSLPMFKE